jgi:hypothetical protein
MFIGVATYSIVVGTMTSFFRDKFNSDNILTAKLKAIENYKEENSEFDSELYKKLR